MSKKRILFIIAGLVVVLLIYIITTYNSLVKREEQVRQDWAEVQNTYQRRLDLVPNLVTVVKGISEFEQSTLEKIAALRSKAASMTATTPITAANYDEQSRLQDSLASAANRLIVLIEGYPELRATEAYLGLQAQLVGTERRIVVARQDFNASVLTYNQKVRGFPTNMVAGLLGFKPKAGFEADRGAENAVKIKFD
jgi:LemA protein